MLPDIKKKWFRIFSERWNDYWFGRDGAISVEVCRIVLGLIYLYINQGYGWTNANSILENYDFGNYHPKGILSWVCPNVPPSVPLLNLILITVHVSTFMMIAGFLSRPASVLALVSNLLLRSFGESFTVSWSHGYNVILLAHLAFLFAPVGKKYSLDFLLRKYFLKREVKPGSNGYWAVLLGQWAVALMFFSGFYWKFIHQAHFLKFLWANSDNLRNQILLRYIWCGDSVPSYLEYLINHQWAFMTFAWTSMILQGVSIASCFFTRKPLLRFLFGLIFMLDELGLNVIMRLYDFHWYPLIVFFIDWDALRVFLRRKFSKNAEQYWSDSIKKNSVLVSGKRAKNIYIVIFLAAYMMFAFNTVNFLFGKSVYELNVYPFSQFKLYSSAMVSYGKPINVPGIRYEISYPGDTNIQSRIEHIVHRNYYACYTYNDSVTLKSNLQAIYKRLKNNFVQNIDIDRIQEIKFFRSVYQFLPYPEKAGAIIPAEGLAAKMDKDGNFYYANLVLQHSAKPGYSYFFKLEQTGYSQPTWFVEYFSFDNFQRKKLEGLYDRDELYFNFPARGSFCFMISIGSQPGNSMDKYMTLNLDF